MYTLPQIVCSICYFILTGNLAMIKLFSLGRVLNALGVLAYTTKWHADALTTKTGVKSTNHCRVIVSTHERHYISCSAVLFLSFECECRYRDINCHRHRLLKVSSSDLSC